MWKNSIILIKTKPITDEAGNLTYQEARKEIFCNEKDVRESEHYRAKAEGLRPEYLIQIRREEYEKEEYAEYEGVKLKVIRKYNIGSEITELTLGGDINGDT